VTQLGRKVLLVGWDGADWKIIQPLLDRGELPVLEHIINGGVMGNLASIRPMLSPMLWTSIATGKRPFKHGVCGFTEVDYELNQVVPVSSTTRQGKAIWNILNERGLKTQVVGWFATHPAEPLDGACVSDRFAQPAPTQLDQEWKLAKDTVHPRRLEESLSSLRVRPEEIPGDVLSMFVRTAEKIDQDHDKRLHQIAIRLSECFSTHAAATYLLEHEPWDFATVYYHSIDLICHDFMPFHPPRRAGVYQPEFEHYSDVVNSIYRLQDAMLGRLLYLAGDDVTAIIVSDHGFKSDHTRPFEVPNIPTGIAAWHRNSGIVAMRGAGLREDELIHGASLLDITPTILTLFGLPIGADMDGRVLVEAFSPPPRIERIESWDKSASRTDSSGGGIEQEQTRQAPRARRSADEEKEVIRQFVEMGYIQDPGDDPNEAIKSTERENRWALAESYLSAGRYADALPLLEAVYEEWPERWDFCCELALCQLHLGLIEEARETISDVIENRKSSGVLLLRANLEYRRRNFEAGLKYLEQAEALDSASAALQDQLGLTRLRLRQPELAEIAFRKAISIDPEDAQAHLGVAICRLRAREYEEAADFALRSIGLRFDLALAHHYLGVALARLGEDARAMQAFETCLRYRPAWNPAHRYLVVLYQRRPNGAADAQRHREYLRGRVARRKGSRAFRQNMRRDVVERARQRAEASRRMRESGRKSASRTESPRGESDAQPSRVSEAMEFIVVSGLPRSGTSLMMQMLDAAGLPVMSDNKRRADENNVLGYFEWEEIKQLPRNPFIIEKAHGHAVKIISMLLPSLPRKHRFRIIFMQRAIAEVAASQQKLRRRLSGTSSTDPARMTEWLREHRDRIVGLLREAPNVDLLEIDYSHLLENPREESERIAEFAKIDPEKIEVMAAVIDPSLRHFGAAAQAV
jgi:predicted AlkP superfamily phosphohydrolase/phosphomutase/tetratricopeptide (TPR) repeat protein